MWLLCKRRKRTSLYSLSFKTHKIKSIYMYMKFIKTNKKLIFIINMNALMWEKNYNEKCAL